MNVRSILGFLIAGFTAAAPVPEPNEPRFNNPLGPSGQIGLFKVTDFRYTCTTTCEWHFNLNTIQHWFQKSSVASVVCQGTIEHQTYQDCSVTDDEPDRTLRAYVERVSGRLKLQGKYLDRTTGKILFYEGEKPVYTETGRFETWIKRAFMVPMIKLEST